MSSMKTDINGFERMLSGVSQAKARRLIKETLIPENEEEIQEVERLMRAYGRDFNWRYKAKEMFSDE